MRLTKSERDEIFKYWKETGATFPQIQSKYGSTITTISKIISDGMGWNKPKEVKEKTPKAEKEIIVEEKVPFSIYSKIGGNSRNRTRTKIEEGLALAPSLHTLKKAVYSSKQGRKK